MSTPSAAPVATTDPTPGPGQGAQMGTIPGEVWENEPRAPGWRKHVYPDADVRTGMQTEYVSAAGERLAATAFWNHVRHQEAVARRQAAAGLPPTPTGESRATAGAPAALDLPDARPDKPARAAAAAGLASPAELGVSAAIGLLIVTGILSLVVGLPELAMNNEEAQAIATPLGNILAKTPINQRFGRYLRDGGDWGLLGYAAYAYVIRVTVLLRARREAAAQPAPPGAQPAAGMGPAPIPGPGGSINRGGFAPVPTGHPGLDGRRPGPAGPAGGSAPGDLAGAGGSSAPSGGPVVRAARGGLAGIRGPVPGTSW